MWGRVLAAKVTVEILPNARPASLQHQSSFISSVLSSSMAGADTIINAFNALVNIVSTTWQASVDRGIGKAELTANVQSWIGNMDAWKQAVDVAARHGGTRPYADSVMNECAIVANYLADIGFKPVQKRKSWWRRLLHVRRHNSGTFQLPKLGLKKKAFSFEGVYARFENALTELKTTMESRRVSKRRYWS